VTGEDDTKRARQGLAGGIAIVAVAYSVNAWFNHTAIGLGVKSLRDAYIIGFFLPVGVILPALFLGWIVKVGWATPRWLGARLGWRDLGATAASLVVGGLLAAAALAPLLREPSALAEAHRLFAALLVASTAEVLIFLGAFANGVQLAAAGMGRWRSGLLALVASSLAFGFFHLTYPAPWNTISKCLGLSVVWLVVSLVFLLSRSLLAAVAMNNVMALIGFLQNRLDLPGTATAGWLRAALAVALFAVVFSVGQRRSHHGRRAGEPEQAGHRER
jgi:MFS family permease